MTAPTDQRSCERCLARSWLLGRLAGHLDVVRGRIDAVLGFADGELVAAVAGAQRREIERELAAVDPVAARQRARAAGIETICRCDRGYPAPLRDLRNPPAVLHVAGGLDRFLTLVAADPVAIVGARKASPYGLDVARALGRGLAGAGVAVISGMALGADSAAHSGALDAGQATVAVLPGAADRPYPARRRSLYARIVATGAAVSELPPGASARRWMFPARNRIIAGLAAMTVVVEAGRRSGALLTAAHAQAAGREVGAVPGRVTAPQAAGTNELLARGAQVVRGPQDVLDRLFGAGVRAATREPRSELSGELRALLSAIADGADTAAAMARAGVPAERGLAALASLELGGHVTRGAGGRFRIVP
ncbi:MAG: DNA-protecting protein DprA [Solirubrobacterales bacterium]|nr:DNA-protecting protein DprA [Solirubrobacterales bacterium]MBV9716086.1 DNA-protecting protein DprA [Solirubrobacterales bacterium]